MVAASACCTYHGIKPVYPSVGHPAYHIAEVDSLHPTLKWEASKELDTAYDLKIMSSADDQNHLYWQKIELKTVYHREKLAGSEHTIEEPLKPLHQYYWAVKASSADSNDWSYYNYHLFAVFNYFYASHLLYSFTTPDTFDQDGKVSSTIHRPLCKSACFNPKCAARQGAR